MPAETSARFFPEHANPIVAPIPYKQRFEEDLYASGVL